MKPKTSPEYIQTSLAASLTLGFQQGLFHRNAKLKGLNLLLHYEEGCLGRCHFCGLSRSRLEGPKGKTFIRVDWPLYSLEEIIGRTKGKDQIHRVCISMITHPKALEDTTHVIKKIKEETDLFISVLITPTLIHNIESLEAMKRAGADRLGIAIDAVTPQLFDQLRGKGVNGPHRWDHYWDVVRMAVEVFGKFYAGIHLIVGLGETEREMVETIQKGQDRSAYTHLFSFFPEKGSPMQDHPSPPLDQYRRIQLARWIINQGLGSIEQMRFDEKGKLVDFGTDIEPFVEMGEPFMTSGCPGRNGKVACNRPYGNERPSGPIRNFPFIPEPEDIEEIKKQLECWKNGILE
ncbi:MAG: radical SAM protein [Thermodesulfobacteriota bacterium]|nr:radical SAM protein [Thermodesulfobacteriota bacterium]